MDITEACQLFDTVMNEKSSSIERCSTGIGNYVFIVSTHTAKYVLRCATEINAYNNTVHWLSRLQTCDIPIPKILDVGSFENYEYLILSYTVGKDIGDIYIELTDGEKQQIAKEVMAIQKKVSMLKEDVALEWNWNSFVDEMLNRSYEYISSNGYFAVSKVDKLRLLQKKLQGYISSIKPIPYLDDISTKNLLISDGHVSGVIDIDWLGFGDVLTFVAMTKVALLNMELDTKYVDYLLEELHPNADQYKAFIFLLLTILCRLYGRKENPLPR